MAREPGAAVTDVPPSRYKVVERGRRLVVIDTRTGAPAARENPSPPPIAAPDMRVDDSSGNAVFTSSPLYDLRGPRRIVMGERLRQRIGMAFSALVIVATLVTIFAPFLWLGLIFALFQPKLRGQIRGRITAQLDQTGQADCGASAG